MKRWIRTGALGVMGISAVMLTACIPDPAHQCSLSAGRTATQTCIDSTDASTLVGTATWTVNSGGLAGLTINPGKTVVLDEDAKLDVRYSAANLSSSAIRVNGGSFYMSPGSSISNYNSSGLTGTYRESEEHRAGLTVENGGAADIYSATIVSAGYAVQARGGGNNTVALHDSVAWGAGGLVSVPTVGGTNSIAAADSTLLGYLGPLIIEPNQAAGPKTKANIHDTDFIDGDVNDPYFHNLLGYIGVNPDPDLGSTSSVKVLTSDSGIHDNTGTGTIYVKGCQASLVTNNQFSTSSAGC